MPRHPGRARIESPRGGVVVIHHMPGYDPQTKEIARNFAYHGYNAVVPNLYWREAPGARMAADPSARSNASMFRFVRRSARSASTRRSNHIRRPIGALAGKTADGAKHAAVTKTATKSRPAASGTRTAQPRSRRNGRGSRQNGKTLSAFITERFDEFSRSQKDVARYIVDHLDEAAFQTAEELARRANTSSSTVVRFSQALGFEGFPELQSAAREEYRRRRVEDTTAVSLSGPLFALDQTEFETALASDHVNVEDTARKVYEGVVAVHDFRRKLVCHNGRDNWW
jgi:hypothetical protein